MILSSLGSPAEASTILGGVVELMGYGDIPIAILIFFASITVPMAKLAGLIYLMISVQRRSRFRPKDRTRLYRVVATIGRWSMVDVFVVAILAALVQFGSLASINPDTGVIAFCGVVVITMFAALAFDPRLIWDAAGANDGR
jgi:paraquat-inducible protein A